MKFLTVVFAIAASGCTSSSAPEGQGMNAVSVATAPAASRRVPKTFEAGGVVRARITATLASRITAPAQRRRSPQWNAPTPRQSPIAARLTPR